MTIYQIGAETLNTRQLLVLATDTAIRFELAPAAKNELMARRKIVEQLLRDNKTVYGINTGFGFLADVKIEVDKLTQLQENLIRSHACGVGEPLAPVVTRALMIAKAHALSLGASGVTLTCMQALIDFLNHNICPLIPTQGSVGASGDLAPLAHMALALMGEGEVTYQNKRVAAVIALQEAGIKPLQLSAKEGLALINGTQFMTAVGAFAIEEARQLAQAADCAAALSLDALRGTVAAYDERIHAARQQIGQRLVAKNMRSIFASNDPIMQSHADCAKVQDPYSFRCVPQVHGASRDGIEYVATIIDRELNSASDNPLIFADGAVISGGNFHGQPVAQALDFLAIAVAELGSIAERRIEKLTNPHMSGLPAFLVKDGGLNSGFMIPHVVAASLVSENKILAHPASVDSIPTSADKEDHVSMGPIAARKARDICRNVSHILAIELLAAAQGIDLLAPLKPCKPLAALYDQVRKVAPVMERDRSLSSEIQQLAGWVVSGAIGGLMQKQGVALE